MYIGIELNKSANVGDVVIIKADGTGGIGAFLMTGERIGEPVGRQPEGCVDYWTMASALFDNRVLCRLAIKCGNTAILQTDSKLLAKVEAARAAQPRKTVPAYGY